MDATYHKKIGSPKTNILLISLFYNLGIYLFGPFLKVLGLLNRDIKKWNQERKKQLEELQLITNKPVVMVHCASLGEYEQIQPLLKLIKESENEHFILLTFFSPSGYNARHNTPYADKVMYLPIDYKTIMTKLVRKVNPTFFIGVKYEFWWNLLTQLHRNKTHIIYTNVSLQKEHYIFKFIFKRYKNLLQKIDMLFVQDKTSLELLSASGFTNIRLNGDMKVDNVVARLNTLKQPERASNDQKIFVWGSIYPYEMLMINEVISSTPDYKHYIVPHHVDDKTISIIRSKLTVEYSMIESLNPNNVIIVNKIGLLFKLYNQAYMAYIGGGMKGGLHNILEPTISGLPTAIGPIHDKFPEAFQLIQQGIVTEIKDAKDIISFIQKYNDSNEYNLVQKHIKHYIQSNTGATVEVYEYFKSMIV